MSMTDGSRYSTDFAMNIVKYVMSDKGRQAVKESLYFVDGDVITLDKEEVQNEKV